MAHNRPEIAAHATGQALPASALALIARHGDDFTFRQLAQFFHAVLCVAAPVEGITPQGGRGVRQWPNWLASLGCGLCRNSHLLTAMRALYLPVAVVLFANSALAQSKWLESKGMAAEEIRTLCERVSDVRPLARTQIMSTGDNLWRRLSRQELEIETAIMGVPPLEQNRCYVIVRAGRDRESERRAFEVRDFAVSSERTSVLVVGRNYALPNSAQP